MSRRGAHGLCPAACTRGAPCSCWKGSRIATWPRRCAGQKILLDRADLPEPGEDEAYLEDLLGCDVLLPEGRRLGRLDHFEYPAGQEIWAIVTDQGDEVLFPARPEFITGFDLAARTVSIDPPEGLLEIYLG